MLTKQHVSTANLNGQVQFACRCCCHNIMANASEPYDKPMLPTISTSFSSPYSFLATRHSLMPLCTALSKDLVTKCGAEATFDQRSSSCASDIVSPALRLTTVHGQLSDTLCSLAARLQHFYPRNSKAPLRPRLHHNPRLHNMLSRSHRPHRLEVRLTRSRSSRRSHENYGEDRLGAGSLHLRTRVEVAVALWERA